MLYTVCKLRIAVFTVITFISHLTVVHKIWLIEMPELMSV